MEMNNEAVLFLSVLIISLYVTIVFRIFGDLVTCIHYTHFQWVPIITCTQQTYIAMIVRNFAFSLE